MTIHIETLKELQKDSKTTHVVEQLLDQPKLHSSVVALPNGVELKNIEALNQYLDRYCFNFNTTSISDYGNYCKEYAIEGAKCFIDESHMVASTTFDLGSAEKPLHKKHTALLCLNKTASFKSILEVNNEKLTQKQASDFIDDWSEFMQILNSDGEPMTTHQASKRIREITIDQIASRENKVSDFSESQSTFEKIEAKNQESIPAEIIFTCQPYRGLGDRAFAIRLSLLTGGEKPILSFRIVKLEAHEEDMAEEFKDVITGTFQGTELKTFIGRG